MTTNYVKTSKTENILDIGIKLSNSSFGTSTDWDRANEVLHEVETALELSMTSAGTGWGVRDMQFVIPPNWDPDTIMNQARTILSDHKVPVDYCNTYEQPIWEPTED